MNSEVGQQYYIRNYTQFIRKARPSSPYVLQNRMTISICQQNCLNCYTSISPWNELSHQIEIAINFYVFLIFNTYVRNSKSDVANQTN